MRQSFGFAACFPSRSAVPSAGLCRRSDLKAVLLTILLHPQDLPHFSFSFPSPNFQETMKRYQWKMLPQSTAYSPTSCQQPIAQTFLLVGEMYPSSMTVLLQVDLPSLAPTEDLVTRGFLFCCCCCCCCCHFEAGSLNISLAVLKLNM